jgi:hypothetical protein
MAARKSPSGGVKPDKLMRDALMLALHREAKAADGTPTKKLYLVADKLVDAAIEGDIQAAKEINDRIDGRVPQAITGEDGGPIEHSVRWLTEAEAANEPS